MSSPSRRHFLKIAAASSVAAAAEPVIVAAEESSTPIMVTYLRCEYLEDPLAIQCSRPRLSWILLAEGRRGVRQTAYRIGVASTAAKAAAGIFDRWDSGKVQSDACNQVEFAGKALASRANCYWRVRIWDEAGKPSAWSSAARWKMGLLSPADWSARWIGVGDSRAPNGRPPRLAIIRATYQVAGGTALVDVTARVAALIQDNRLSLVVNNATMGGDPQLGQHKVLHLEYMLDGVPQAPLNYAEDVTVTLPLANPDRFDPSGLAIPANLRREFALRKPVRRATVYATALGLYELWLNGQRVGDRLLTPEWTSYHKRVQYQAYDVTGLLKPGENAIGAILGNGWYCGLWQHWPPKIQLYGTEPWLLAQLEVEFTDGTRTTIATDSGWKTTTSGPLRFAGLYEGEVYDARRQFAGWSAAGFADAHWLPAKIGQDLKAGALEAQRSQPIRAQLQAAPSVASASDLLRGVDENPALHPADFVREKPPIKVTQPTPGVWVMDFGQNMAGWCRLKMQGRAGQTIVLKHNEMLAPDGAVYMDNLHAGHMSRGDRQTVRYTFAGDGVETYEPRFTYMGFRYVQVEGLTEAPPEGAFTSICLHTDCPEIGEFRCSHELVNRLAENILWSQRSNFMGVPTDCPSRDERCGYTGDAQFFLPTAIYNMDVAAFFSKWLVDVCDDSQRPDGGFADHAPDFGVGISWNVGWYDAGIICPHRFYRTYGDTRVLRDHYAAMKRCLQMQERTSEGNLRTRIGNGDWLNLGGGASAAVIGTAYFAYDYFLMAEIAAAIGETADSAAFQKRATEIAATFHHKLIGPDGKINDSSQTGYALAFTMGLVPEALRQALSDRFADEVTRFHDHLATGFIGTPRLLPALHLAGRDDLAYRLLLQQDYPSWLYPITLGATSMWERWNGWSPEHGFADSGMNSFNHYSFGAVGEYLYGGIGGIQAEAPGFKRIRIQPAIEKGLFWASTNYRSLYGTISTSWERKDDGLVLAVAIPANTSATVHVPTGNAAGITESGKPIGHFPGVTLAEARKNEVLLNVASGVYRFAWKVVAGG